MSVAKEISDFDAAALAWLEIEDEDGVKYRYAKGGVAPGRATSHVMHDILLSLLLEVDGKPILRQDGPGLPAKIVVVYIKGIRGPAPPVSAEWVLKYEYERE